MTTISARRILSSALAAYSVASGGAFSATLIYQEDFGNVTPSTAITSSNTSLGAARPSNGSLTATTSTIGTGSSLRFSAATTAGTASGAWIAKGSFGALTTMTMEFSVTLSTMQTGALGITMGNGNTVANNLTNDGRNNDHFLWDLAILGASGKVQHMTSTGTYQDTGATLSAGLSYQFLIQVNATAAAVDGVAANTMSLYINGALVADDLQLRGATSNANGFRMGARSATAAGDLVGEIDDIRVSNGIVAVPEPSMAVLCMGGAVLALRRQRRDSVKSGSKHRRSIHDRGN